MNEKVAFEMFLSTGNIEAFLLSKELKQAKTRNKERRKVSRVEPCIQLQEAL